MLTTKIITFTLTTLACSCSSTLPQAPETRLAARFSQANTHEPCVPGQPSRASCLDDYGLVWSGCAWTSCGQYLECRAQHQALAAASNCGEPQWPSCEGR